MASKRLLPNSYRISYRCSYIDTYSYLYSYSPERSPQQVAQEEKDAADLFSSLEDDLSSIETSLSDVEVSSKTKEIDWRARCEELEEEVDMLRMDNDNLVKIIEGLRKKQVK